MNNLSVIVQGFFEIKNKNMIEKQNMMANIRFKVENFKFKLILPNNFIF